MPVQRWSANGRSAKPVAADQQGEAAGLAGQPGEAAAQMAALVQTKIKA
jgi:hypothetical protein